MMTIRNRSTSRLWRAALGAGAFAFAAALPAQAQDGALGEFDEPLFVEDAESMDAVELIDRRERERMHPSDPFKIVGIAQGENSFRKRLHAAGRGEYRPAGVDEEELRGRQLAMYEAGAVFSSGIRPRRGMEPPAEAPHAAPQDPAKQEERESTAWIGMVLAAASSITYFVMKGRLGQ